MHRFVFVMPDRLVLATLDEARRLRLNFVRTIAYGMLAKVAD